jgi:general secretion pathway protein L
MEYLIIQVAESHVTAARFEISGRSASLLGAAAFKRDDENSLSSIAQRIADGVTGSPRVVLCLPAALFAQRGVELPLTDLRKVREVLPAHLQGEMVLSSDEVVFDVLSSGGGRFLAVWAKKTDINNAVEIFKTSGIEPHIVTSGAFSWGMLPGIPADAIVSDGNVLVVMLEGRLLSMRVIDSGDKRAQISAVLSALELSGTALPKRMIVFGEQAAMLTEADNTAPEVDLLELPTELAALFRTDAAFQQLAELYAVARNCHTGTSADFRRGELAWTAGDARQRKKLLLTALLAFIAVTLLFVSKGMQYRAARADITSLNKSISSLYREIFPSRTKVVDELAEVRGEIKKLSGIDSSRGVLDVFRLLAEAKGTTINGLYEAELEGRTLQVKGDARSAQAVNDFKSALSPVMMSIEMGEVKSRPDGSVSFSLSGTIKETVK